MTSKYANRTEKNLSPVTFKNLVFDGTAPNPQPQRKSEFYELPPIAAPNLCRGNPKICRGAYNTGEKICKYITWKIMDGSYAKKQPLKAAFR